VIFDSEVCYRASNSGTVQKVLKTSSEAMLQNVRAAATKTKCTAEFVWRPASSFVSRLNHLVTTQHVPWEPSWSVRFGSTNKVNRPHYVYIRDGSFACMTYEHGCIFRHLSPLGGKTVCLKMGPAWQVWVARPPDEAMGQVPRYQLNYIGELNNPVQGESVHWIK